MGIGCGESQSHVSVQDSSWAPALWWRHSFPGLWLCLRLVRGCHTGRDWLGNWVGQKQLMTGNSNDTGAILAFRPIKQLSSLFLFHCSPFVPLPYSHQTLLVKSYSSFKIFPATLTAASYKLKNTTVVRANLFWVLTVPETVLSSVHEFTHWILTATV